MDSCTSLGRGRKSILNLAYLHPVAPCLDLNLLPASQDPVSSSYIHPEGFGSLHGASCLEGGSPIPACLCSLLGRTCRPMLDLASLSTAWPFLPSLLSLLPSVQLRLPGASVLQNAAVCYPHWSLPPGRCHNSTFSLAQVVFSWAVRPSNLVSISSGEIRQSRIALQN